MKIFFLLTLKLVILFFTFLNFFLFATSSSFFFSDNDNDKEFKNHKEFKSQNPLEKKINFFVTSELQKNNKEYLELLEKRLKVKPYTHILESFTNKNHSIYLAKYVMEKNWSEVLYLVVISQKKKFGNKKYTQKILWIKEINPYGRIVERAKFKKDKNKLKIYTITVTTKGSPSLEIFEIPINNFPKKKLKILMNMKPNIKKDIAKINKKKKELDKEFNLFSIIIGN